MDPEGAVFVGRGALIRHLHANRLRKKEQLEVLKKLLKVNQTKHFEELRKNDKFIKHIEVDENYLTFLKHRYMNHQEFAEEEEPSLPRKWRKYWPWTTLSIFIWCSAEIGKIRTL